MSFVKLSSFAVATIVVLMIQVYLVGCDQSDDECKISQSKIVSPDSKTPTRNESSSETEVVQKSLLIVFDGTGSMGDDLAVMIPAAKEIIKTFHERPEKPIKNYVLIVFQDPSMMTF